MRAIRRHPRYAVLSLLVLQFFISHRSLGQGPSLITQPVDDAQRVTLKGNVHPMARTEFDRGAALPDLAMDRMLLVLKRSPEQDAALGKLLDDQQDKHSPHYRKWLTPEQVGIQFGPSHDDIEKVTGWLGSQGFHDIHVSKGRTVIEFSGTAGQLQSALGTTIRKYVVAGQSHWANSNDPSIPAALSPVVAGVFTLHNFYKKPQSHLIQGQFTAKAVRQSHPEFTSSRGAHALAPADYYTIYNFNPLGSGSSHIAITGRSNIDPQDPLYFHYWMYDQATNWDVVVNGPDPGDLGGGEELEADLDITWASVVAPSDWVTLVVSQSTATTDGVDLSEQYIVDNNYADVMSESFGDCEANYTTTQAAGIASLAQQAAAQGITYVVAAGDSGSAGCDDPNKEKTAVHGLSVNMLASTPYTVAVGGTVFNENGHDSTYWNSTNASPTQESAISYIPEDVWNDSCSSCSTPNIWAGGGGASTFFTKPSWQSGVTGIPNDGKRDLPDVSLTAAAHDPYLICLAGSCVPNAQGEISFYGVAGTSASTPAFAGMMALVANRAGTRLGAPNYVLYRLAAAENLAPCNASSSSLPASTCVFNDVTVGNNAVGGETGYGTSGATYQSSKGYDLATGLGSVNVTNLINQWSTVTFSPTTTTLSVSPTSIVHGSAVNVSGTVTPNSGTGTATGTIWLTGQNGNIAGQDTIDMFSLGGAGAYSGGTHVLPGGTYQVHAHYAGDQTYAPSDSGPAVQVNIQPEPTTITFSVSTKDGSGNFVPFTSGPYGTPVYYKAQLSWQSGYGVPSSYVLFWDNGSADATPYVDSKGNATSPALTQINAGSHSITAGYYGDNSFSSSDDLTPINFTVTQLSTTTVLSSQQTTQSLLLTATVSANGSGIPATGTITFSSGGTVLGAVQLTPGTTANGVTQATATLDGSQLAAAQYSVTASYPGDANYMASTSPVVSLNLVADFSIDNRGFASQSVTAGQTAQYINDLGITPFFGYTSTVTVSCTVPAQAAACSINPNSYALASGPGIGTIAITTMARSAAAVIPSVPWRGTPLWSGEAAATILLGIAIIGPRRKRPLVVPAFCVLALLAGMVACGGSGSGSGGGGGGGGGTGGTPAGTYTVTVTGTAGSTTHTTTFTLIVQ
jgi:hypothetical protein